ncbi:serine/threonine-protein kinase [Streptomyces viridochromogenes]|uniref:serine/threonine-protein kinase n=1 Tax=Streptomyces viridochromogenes TaxID=1938 RepID=UPI00069F8967|nr:serine/threonine-protein kinase [Streptomyces viridochromogenes]KOG25126.1 serine/threonine protein kinase [Streptomyces viridochromogenes]KOG25430.1 serine/threonine protein kinase [Streptomyces viridochromogenes]
MTDHRQPGPSDAPAFDHATLKQAGTTPLQPADPGRIGPYVPLGRLGSGGMGRVYLARPADAAPGLAAVKVIRPEYAEDPRFRRRFEREAALHSRVHSPRAPQLLGTGFDDTLLWMATQYVPGLNLADAVRDCGTLAPAGVWRLVADLGQALSAMAAADVVHRDLKPSNVILSPQGAHVIDFGIAQAADSSAITSTGSRVGTPAFMAPEYLREGRCDTASDVFSLAGSLIYAATGHAPFGDGTGVDVMHRVAFEEPKSEIMAELAAVDPALAALLAACLAKDPAGRPTPRQFIDAATAAGHGHDRAASWHEPLHGRLLARGHACEVLERVAVQEAGRQAGHETVQLRTPSEGTAFPARGPVVGTPTPPEPYATAPTTSAQAPAPEGGGRGKRKAYLGVVAGLAVCAVAVGAFFLTRPSVDETASAAATATESTAPDDAPASPLPTSSASPSDDKEKAEGEEKGTDSKGTEDEESADPDASAGGTGGGAVATPADDKTSAPPGGDASGGSGSGGTAPTATPTKTATTPATPPWLSDCTSYSGTELTVRGDRGQRVVQVQCMLTKRGYSVGGSGVDGQFGADTESAVRLFQSDKGLAVDGEVGPDTWGALRRST